jgi:hypothetical protein
MSLSRGIKRGRRKRLRQAQLLLGRHVGASCFLHDVEVLTHLISSRCCRLILPLKRFRLSEEQLEKPIPTLSDRQFVVDKTGMSSSEARLQRELFWYREDLFKCVRARWQEVCFLNGVAIFNHFS